MANLLTLIDDLNRELYHASLHDHDFGYGLYPRHIQAQPPVVIEQPENHHHLHHQREPTIAQILGLRSPAHHQSAATRNRAIRVADEKAKREGQQLSTIGKDGLQICMDVAQFLPSELSVKVVDKTIIVEGKHDERPDDHGYISRYFKRRYTLPEDYEPERVLSTLSSDGILTVSVPKPQTIEDSSKERHIPIQQTGPAHLNIKPNEQTDADNNDVVK